eukprot:gene13748-18225_t
MALTCGFWPAPSRSRPNSGLRLMPPQSATAFAQTSSKRRFNPDAGG